MSIIPKWGNMKPKEGGKAIRLPSVPDPVLANIKKRTTPNDLLEIAKILHGLMTELHYYLPYEYSDKITGSLWKLGNIIERLEKEK